MSAPPASCSVTNAACMHGAAPLAGRFCHGCGVAIVRPGFILDQTTFATAVAVTFNLT